MPGLDEKEHNLGSEEEDEESGDEQNETTNQKWEICLLFLINFVFRSGGWFSAFANLVGNKQLTESDVEPALEQMKLNLIRK